MMTSSPPRPLVRVAIAGLGAIGLEIAHSLDRGLAGYRLAAVSANDRERAVQRVGGLARPVPVVGIGELEPLADLVIECAPANARATPRRNLRSSSLADGPEALGPDRSDRAGMVSAHEWVGSAHGSGRR